MHGFNPPGSIALHFQKQSSVSAYPSNVSCGTGAYIALCVHCHLNFTRDNAVEVKNGFLERKALR